MKKTMFALYLIWCSHVLTGQIITLQDLPFEKVTKISKINDTLVNKFQSPALPNDDNGLAYRIISTHLFYSGADPESKRIKELCEKIANEYITKNAIKDNGVRKERYTVIHIENHFQLRKHQTIKRYVFEEGAGVKSYISIDEDPGFSEKDIFCIFNNNVDYPDSDFALDTILPPSGDRVIFPNKRITYKDDRNNYDFTYTAKLCTGDFEFRGLGTMGPVYFNLILSVKDKNSGKTQTLFQIPHDHYFKLNSIQIGDINSDNRKDIVLEIETELCTKRLIYLSSKDSNNTPFSFIGHMMIDCDYP